MSSNNDAVYLPIRALGDFVISAAVVKDRFDVKIPLLLPTYLSEIFKSIKSERYFDVVREINYLGQPAFFEMHKVKDFKNFKRLLSDLRKIYSITNNKKTYLLDYKSNRIGFTKANLEWPALQSNIYTGKFEMFSRYFSTAISSITNTVKFNCPNPKILILPGSRLPSKILDKNLVQCIVTAFTNYQVAIAEFGNQISTENVIRFNNFETLMELINNYDLVISAESLPYHLAYYLNKAHFVIYNRSKHFKKTFMTPFMLQNNYFATFRGDNTSEIINRLQEILDQPAHDENNHQ